MSESKKLMVKFIKDEEEVSVFGKKKKKIAGVLLMDLMAVLIFWKYFLEGGKVVCNALFGFFGRRFLWFLPEYEVLVSGAERMIVMVLFLGQVFLVLGTIFYLIVKWNHWGLKGFWFWGWILFWGIFGKEEQGVWFLFISAGLLLLWMSDGNGEWKKRAFFVRAGMLFAVFFLVSILVHFAGGEKDLKQAEGISSFFQEKLNDFRYGKSDLWEGKVVGNQRMMSEKEKEETALMVTMKVPQSCYLKGFVGSVFKNGRWSTQNPDAVYQNAEMFFWMHRENFYSQSQLYEAAKQFQTLSDDEQNHMKIEIAGAGRKYYFLPYEFQNSGAFHIKENRLLDESVLMEGFFGRDSYEIELCENQVVSYPEILEKIKNGAETEEEKKYLIKESYYNSYVYEMDLELSEEERKILKNHLGIAEGNDSHESVFDAKKKILEFLGSEIHYDENTVFSEKNNFLKEFLEISGKGSDTAYATAAVLMFRYFGIPARYVEGYLITPKDALQMKQQDGKWKVKKGARHAWAEYYQDGVGFLPFEVSPPYIGVMESASLIRQSEDQTALEQLKSEKQENAEELLENTEEEDHILTMKNLFTAGMIFIFLFLLCVLLTFAGRVAQKKKRWKQKLASKENADAIKNQMEYMMEVLFAFRIQEENISLERYEEKIVEWENKSRKGKEAALKVPPGHSYREVLMLFRKAKFGGRDCDSFERKIVKEYCERIRKNLYSDFNIKEKLRFHLKMGYLK